LIFSLLATKFIKLNLNLKVTGLSPVCCLGPPSDVRNLTVDGVDETTVSLSWRRPTDSGGRSDVWYSVDCDACNDKFVLYRPRQTHFNDTSYVSRSFIHSLSQNLLTSRPYDTQSLWQSHC